MMIGNQATNIINNNIDKYKEDLEKLLTELVTKYVELGGQMEFVTGFINSKGQYVTLQERSCICGIDYSIRSTMLDSEYGNEYEIEGGEIIFQLDTDYYLIDSDELESYEEDYNDYIKNKDKYIKDKVDYIISLTW